MGYYVQIISADCRILAEHLDAAFEAMKALNHQPGIVKNGGSWVGGKQTYSCFSWMDADYDEKCKDAAEILSELGFTTDAADNGDLAILYYDNKTGQEDLFLAAIAPFLNEGAYIEWQGEEGSRWRWTPEGTQHATISYS